MPLGYPLPDDEPQIRTYDPRSEPAYTSLNQVCKPFASMDEAAAKREADAMTENVRKAREQDERRRTTQRLMDAEGAIRHMRASGLHVSSEQEERILDAARDHLTS
jgi:hypothetical protein